MNRRAECSKSVPARTVITLLCAMAALTLVRAQGRPPVRAFTGARVFEGSDRAPLENAILIVKDGRIEAVGPVGRITIPEGAERVSVAGKWIIPGLVNAHGHVGNTVGLEQGHYSAENVARDLRTYAVYGVTTVFSLGDDQAAGIAARDAQRTATLDRARLFVAGPVLAPKTPEEAVRLVDEVAAMKTDIVKIRVDDNLGTTPKMTPDIYKAVIDQAHKRNMRVAVHLFYLEDAKAVLDAGADFIAHSIRDTEVDDAVIGMLKRRNVCYCPTLTRELSTFVYETTPAWFTDPLFTKYADARTIGLLKEPARQEQMKSSRSAQRYKVALEQADRNLKKLSDAGVAIAMGTDTGPPV
jgi:imidazolonepropionase-like amidohydrolase